MNAGKKVKYKYTIKQLKQLAESSLAKDRPVSMPTIPDFTLNISEATTDGVLSTLVALQNVKDDKGQSRN